jgi:hypothetical protein
MLETEKVCGNKEGRIGLPSLYLLIGARVSYVPFIYNAKWQECMLY